MRKQFVVLVSLFIGLSSGFIAPSSISEVVENVSLSGLNTSMPHKDSSRNNLDIIGKINENELYQSDEKKANNVNERSFILINKNHRKVFTNHLIKSWMPGFYKPVDKYQSNQKLPQRYTKTQQPETRLQSLSQQSYNLNVGHNKQSQHYPIFNQAKYPRPPKIHQLNNTGTLGAHLNQKNNNILEQGPKSMKAALSKQIEKIDDSSIQPYMKSIKINSGNINDKYHSKYNQANTKTPLSNKKLRILSYFHRKPDHCLSCNFVKANWLNRMNFAQKNEADKYNSINIDGINFSSFIGNMYEDIDDLNIERYMKDTLAEAEMSDETNTEFSYINEKTIRKEDSDFIDKSNEITEYTNTRTSDAVKRKESHTTRYANNDKQVYEDYFEMNNITDIK